MRIGVSLPDTLLDKFDEIIKKKGYPSRSEAIRDAIRSYITYYGWMNDIKGHRVGTIAVIYDHTKKRYFRCSNRYPASLLSPYKIFSAYFLQSR